MEPCKGILQEGRSSPLPFPRFVIAAGGLGQAPEGHADAGRVHDRTFVIGEHPGKPVCVGRRSID